MAKINKKDQANIIRQYGYEFIYTKYSNPPVKPITKHLYYLDGDLFSVDGNGNSTMLSKRFFKMDKIEHHVKSMQEIGTKCLILPDSEKIYNGW